MKSSSEGDGYHRHPIMHFCVLAILGPMEAKMKKAGERYLRGRRRPV